MKKFLVKILTLTIALAVLVGAMPLGVLANELAGGSKEAKSRSEETPGYIEVNDGYVRIQVSEDNGGFYIGLVEGDKLTKADDNKHLIYPDSDYDTSFTSFRVKQDGVTRDFIFGGDYSHIGLESTEVKVYQSADNAITAEWGVGGIIFRQIIAFMDTNSAMHGMAYITYSVENNSGKPIEDIDARVMMDTALGYQDYAVYMTANENGSFNTVTSEKTISGEDYNNFFYLYDSRTAPTVVAYTVNAQVAGKTVVPEKVTFAHWNNLASTEFDYEPDTENPLDFTSIYNADYMTADSAVALYYDMGAVDIGGTGRAIGLYYGVYSNHTVEDSAVGLNIINSDVLELNADKTDYLDANGERNGNFSMDVRLQNVSDKEIESLALAVMPGEFMYPYSADGPVENATLDEPYYIEIKNLKPGEIRDIRLDFEVDISVVTDYRRIRLSIYNSAYGVSFTDDYLLLTKDSYVFCPGSTSAELGFTGMVPQMTGESGRRFVYITGSNFNLLRDKSQYRVVLRPTSGGEDIVIDSARLVVNPELNTATVVIDEELKLGTYQAIIDWNDTAIPDIISDALRLDVLSAEELDRAAISAAISTAVSIVRSGSGGSDPFHYEIVEGYAYDHAATDVMLTLTGNFNVISSPAKGIYKAEAITLSSSEVINISGCLDVKGGRVTVTVEYDENGKQTAINVDIDGKIYTTGANTKVWDGVCAITSFEEGKQLSLTEYSSDGEREEVKGDNITLLWPGAASGAQTLVGLLLEMRYCEFGIMDMGKTQRRVVAFSAQLSPSFLVPNGSQYEAARSPREEEEQRIVYANYTANDLRRVDNRYQQSDKQWREDQAGTLNMYIDDILFGGYFIGFNTSVEVGIPAIVDGMPYIEGTLSLKIINDEWEFGLEGAADFNIFEMEASLILKSYNGFPVLDKFSFFIGGFFPGVMVDPFGVFWIRGAGGGIENLYETFFGSNTLPPITLTLCGEFAIFAVLSAKANLSLSLYGFEAYFSDISVAGISIIDYLGGSVYWYPDLSIACRIDVSIFDVIVGGGAITARKDFFEAYIYAGIQIPNDIWFIGGLEIGSAELGVSTEKIWGKVKVIGIGVGVTYYWGGDVDVDLLSQMSAAGFDAVKVGTDGEGNALYIKPTNNVRVLHKSSKKTSGVVALSLTSGSSTDKRNHTFDLDTALNEDGLITLTYKASSALEASDLKDTIAVTVDGENYALKWFENELPADDSVNTNTNALLKYDPRTKEATVSISFTDPGNQSGKEICITTGVASDVIVYGVERFADLTYAAKSGETVTVFGDGIASFASVNVYARDTEDNVYQIGSADLTNVRVDSEGNESLDIPLVYPESLPGGSYTVEVVGCLKDSKGNEISNPIVEIEGSFTHTNEYQPKELQSVTAALGGNYTISLNVTPFDTDFDGYMIDIYEVTEDGFAATDFNNVQISLPDGESKAAGEISTLTVGGRILNTDENGGQFYTGLEEGKTYRVSVSTYKTTPSGAVVESKAITTESLVMVKPTKTEPKLNAEGAKQISAGATGLMVDTVKTSNVTVKVSDVGVLKSGYYTVNDGNALEWDGKDISFAELQDGAYTLTVGGVNETGDSFSTVYQFSVDTVSPSLLINSHQGGGFFSSDSTTVTGTSEPGAKITASVAGKSVSTVASVEGSFSVNIPLDITGAYQEIRLTAEDAVGNVSAQYGFTLTNMLLGKTDLELVILIDEDAVTHISASDGPIKLSLAFRSGDKIISINENSASWARINWKTSFVMGNGSIGNDGTFTSESGSVGIVSATLDNLSATVEVVPTSILSFETELNIPEGGYVYDGEAKEPEIAVSADLELGVDYTVTYINNVNAGTATVIVSSLDSGKCSGSKLLTFTIGAASLSEVLIVLDNGSVTVKLADKELTASVDYTLSTERNEASGEGLITVTGIGNYTGTKNLLFTIEDSSGSQGGTSGGEPDTEIDPDIPEEDPGTEEEPEAPTDDPDTEEEPDNSGDSATPEKRSWFSKNAIWVIPIGVILLEAIAICVYFPIFKKQNPIKGVLEFVKKKKKDGEPTDNAK